MKLALNWWAVVYELYYSDLIFNPLIAGPNHDFVFILLCVVGRRPTQIVTEPQAGDRSTFSGSDKV